jgi:hypothetical protein
VTSDDARPRWVRDLTRFLPLKSQFVLTGNVRDLQIRRVGDLATAAPLSDVLSVTLADAGYADVVRYDPIQGFEMLPRPDGIADDPEGILAQLGLTPASGRAPAGADLFGSTIKRLVSLDGPPVALVADFASRLIVRTDALSPIEQQLFTRALVLGQTATARPVGPERAPRFTCIIWIVEKEGDLPDWLMIDNPRLRHIPIAPPDRAARKTVAPSLIRGLPGAREAMPETLVEAEDDLVDATEGLLLIDLNAIAQLARARSFGPGSRTSSWRGDTGLCRRCRRGHGRMAQCSVRPPDRSGASRLARRCRAAMDGGAACGDSRHVARRLFGRVHPPHRPAAARLCANVAAHACSGSADTW